MIRRQIELFLTALMFLTRVPCPSWVRHESDSLAKSTAYFPPIGMLVGGFGGLVAWVVARGYSPLVAVLAGMAATVIVTGAFHEDAFADVCDGFGGWTPERRLEIMRDSRVGSFGVVGIVLIVGLKAAVLCSLPVSRLPLAFVTAHTLGRWSCLALIRLSPYVTDAKSLAKPFADSVRLPQVALGTLFTVPLCLFSGLPTMIVLFALTLALCVLAGRFFRNWLGGISGDCLGAVNQIVEFACYAVLIHSAGIDTFVRSIGR